MFLAFAESDLRIVPVGDLPLEWRRIPQLDAILEAAVIYLPYAWTRVSIGGEIG
jgi:hypothetical protein